MNRLITLFLFLYSLEAFSQTSEGMDAILKLTGCGSPEEVDPYEAERLADYLQHPLKINSSDHSDLEKSGLFSAHQVASLIDYMSRHGDVLSITELAAIDGFMSDTAGQIAPFISFDTACEAGRRSGTDINCTRQDLSMKGGYRHDDEHAYKYGARYRLVCGPAYASAGVSRKYDAKRNTPSELTAVLSFDHRRGKVMFGDFNARFGQGLCLWNSAVIGSLSSPSAFMRKPSGITPSYSYNGTYALTGAAADVYAGRWHITAIMAAPGVKDVREHPDKVRLQPAANVSYITRYGHVSLTHSSSFSEFLDECKNFRIPEMKSAIDVAFCIRGVNVFGESAYDWINSSVGAVFGTDFKVCEEFRMASLIKYLPSAGFSNEYGASLSGELRMGQWIKPKDSSSNTRRCVGSFTAEASYYPESKSKNVIRCIQAKALCNFTCTVTDVFQIRCRLTERFRTWGLAWKTDVRLDMVYSSHVGYAALRLNMLDSRKTGYLGYAEGGLRTENMQVYLRSGMFHVDEWDDRIYVYERDSPGNFTVPAFYGRGMWVSIYCSYRPAYWCRMYVRGSYTGYPFMDQKIRKPGRAELALQLAIRI